MPQQPGLFESDNAPTPHRASALKAVGAVLAVAVVPLALVVGHLPERAASATVQPAAIGTPAFVPNWIAIQTGSTSAVTLNGPGGLVATQSLAPAANCGVNLGGSELITLQGSTTLGTAGPYSAGLASYLAGSIGVKEKKSGTSCYQVNAVTTESLKLALGTGVAGALGPDAVATSAYLDVELKGGVRILATATLKGQPVGKWELQSGSERSTPVTAGAVEFECNPAADSGADSNISDNCRWPISGPSWLGDDGKVFDTLTLEAKAGAFSLEGGADGAVLPAPPYTTTPNASIIEIAADTLNCGASTATEPAAGDTPSVSVFRLQNANGLTCDLIPYALENGPNLARFLKALDSQTSAQFIWDIRGPVTRIPDPDPSKHSTDIPITIDYETPDAQGNSPLVTLGYCPNPTYTTDGRFAGYTDAQIAALGEDQDDYPGIQYACLISRTAKAIAGTTNTMQVNDLVYVYGDATMRR